LYENYWVALAEFKCVAAHKASISPAPATKPAPGGDGRGKIHDLPFRNTIGTPAPAVRGASASSTHKGS